MEKFKKKIALKVALFRICEINMGLIFFRNFRTTRMLVVWVKNSLVEPAELVYKYRFDMFFFSFSDCDFTDFVSHNCVKK